MADVSHNNESNKDEPSLTEETMEIIPDEEGDLPDLQKKLKKSKSGLVECEREKKEYLEGWQRAKADFINYRKDEAKRFEDLGQFVTAGFLQELLPVLDSFDLALRSFVPGSEGERGVLLIRAQLTDILKKRGIEMIEVKPGDLFDPGRHESMGEIESDEKEGSVAEELQKGYLLRGSVVRPARVRLSKGAT